MRLSPLFWPVRLQGDTIYILDESLIPQRLRYIKVKNYQEACLAIKQMKTRSVGQVLLVMYTFLLAIRQKKTNKRLIFTLNKIAQAMNACRPTLPFKVLTDTVLGWAKSPASLENCILGFLETLKEKRIQQAKETSKIIKDKDVILTHCNVSGLMPLIGEFCRGDNKGVSFFVTQTPPYFQGLRLTAWELKQAGFEVVVIADNMVSQVMSEGRISKVIVGADHLAQNGDIANKIGTYQIAILARHFKIPFYVLCPPASEAKTGRDIRIEIRPDRELLRCQGLPFASSYGIKAYYPAFDVTPAYLITRHIHLKTRL